MTVEEFVHLEGWITVGRFFDISPLDDDQRGFLEMIPKFREAQDAGAIPEDGYKMPDIGGVVVGKIFNISTVPLIDPDNPTFNNVIVVVQKIKTAA